MKDETICNYGLAWVGNCKNEKPCEKHSHIKCSSCGEPATHECEATSQFVCGFPLCDDCEHTLHDNGCSSGGNLPSHLKGHCKKTEQVYKPWYMHDKKSK